MVIFNIFCKPIIIAFAYGLCFCNPIPFFFWSKNSHFWPFGKPMDFAWSKMVIFGDFVMPTIAIAFAREMTIFQL